MTRQVVARIESALAGVLWIGASAFGADSITTPQPANPPVVDKSGYTLLNPTPRQFMRELSADRPDKTESAYTVDAGHFQLELDFVSYTSDRTTEETVHAVSVAPFNLKVGLTNNSDLQFIAETFTRQNTSGHDGMVRSGFGDVVVRWKVNLFGNDGGRTGLGIISFAKFPTNQDGLGNNAVEGAMIFPLEIKLA